ncbi:MAG: stage II sporulation protein R [Syntrophomonas sp.]
MLKKVAFVFLIIFIALIGIYTMEEEGKPLNESVLRLHVIANSNSPTDQALKIEVKDAVVKLMSQEFRDIDDITEARHLAVNDIPRIKETAERVISSRGCNYQVEVKVGEAEFPTKSYGNLVFPQGDYQAVRIIIGQGQGKNWWCVLFPPLCMVSSSDKGLTLDNPRSAKVSFKCLELIPRGVKIRASHQ